MGNSNQSLDSMDLALIKELENNPLASNSELAVRLYASRNTIARRIQQFQDRQIISISTIRHMEEFGYSTMAFFFINVEEGKVKTVAETLKLNPILEQVNISTGQYDIMAFGWFLDNQDLLSFTRNGIGNIPEVISCQTMIALSSTKAYYPLIERGKETSGKAVVQPCTDELELRIIDELEKNPRRSHTDMARELGVVRHTVSRKLNELINNRVISIVTYVSPLAQGYQISSSIMLKVRPCNIDMVAEKLATYSEVQDVIIGTGHYDIIALAVFHNEDELSQMVSGRISPLPGVLSHETIIIQSGVKSLFGLLI